MTLSGVEKLRDLISVHRDNKSATLLSIPWMWINYYLQFKEFQRQGGKG
jgi:hypothetical protein